VDLPDRRAAALAWRRAVDAGGTFDHECRITAAQAPARWHVVHASRLSTARPGAWLITATDVDAVKQSEQRMGEFVAFLAHELAGPLTTISGNAHILNARLGSLPPKMRYSALQDIETETERLLRLTAALLRVARMELGDPQPVRAVEIDTLLGELVSQHRSAYPHRHVSIDVLPASLHALAVPEFLEEIIANYLANAEKYSPDRNTPIEISARGDGRWVRIVVADRGIGVRADEIDRLFLPFVRGTAAAHRVGGTGMGLAICRRLAELQGCSAWAAPREGGGAQFGLVLAEAQFEEVA
jgi:two-component system sensor histidine kinase MprB